MAAKRFGLLKKILLVLAVIILLFIGIVAMQPADFRISRDTKIAAPADVVFAQINDLHNWPVWSPWAKLDPAVKNEFEGAASGTGAVFKWAGNSEVGKGRMTITESRPNELVKIKLDFIKPWEATSNTEFTFKPEGEQIAVTWVMTGRHSFVEKAFCLFMNMDKMIGGDFEKGLAQMKVAAEGAAKK